MCVDPVLRNSRLIVDLARACGRLAACIEEMRWAYGAGTKRYGLQSLHVVLRRIEADAAEISQAMEEELRGDD